MRKLVVTDPAVIQAAVKEEGTRSPQSRFVHRSHCVLLVGSGYSCRQVARLFGDDPRSVQRWVREFQRRGVEGLRDKPHPGRHSRLIDAQLQELELALGRAGRELGYPGNGKNVKMLCAEILRRFGVSVSLRHCQRLLTSLGRSADPERPAGTDAPSTARPPTHLPSG